MKVIVIFSILMSSLLFHNTSYSAFNEAINREIFLVSHEISACDTLIVSDSISGLVLYPKVDTLDTTADTITVVDTLLKDEPLESNLVLKTRDSILVSDSLINILLKARKVECKLLSQNPSDTTRSTSSKVVPRYYINVIKFLLLDQSNYLTNDIVYGLFKPDVSYKFYLPNKDYLYVQLDFGLKKWKILDSDIHELAIADMKNSAYYFLLLTKYLFPNDTTLELLYDTLKPF